MKRTLNGKVLTDVIHSLHGLIKFNWMINGKKYLELKDYEKEGISEEESNYLFRQRLVNDLEDLNVVYSRFHLDTIPADKARIYSTGFSRFPRDPNFNPVKWLSLSLDNPLNIELNNLANEMYMLSGKLEHKGKEIPESQGYREGVWRGMNSLFDFAFILKDFHNLKIALNSLGMIAVENVFTSINLIKNGKIFDETQNNGLNMNLIKYLRYEPIAKEKRTFLYNLQRMALFNLGDHSKVFIDILKKIPQLDFAATRELAEGCPAAHTPSKLGQIALLLNICKYLEVDGSNLDPELVQQSKFIARDLNAILSNLGLDLKEYYSNSDYSKEIELQFSDFNLENYPMFHQEFKRSEINRSVINDVGERIESLHDSIDGLG